MAPVLQVEGNVVGALRQQDDDPAERMGVPDLIEDVGILAGHVRDDDVRLVDLVEDAIQHAFGVELFIHTLGVSAGHVGCFLDADAVHVVKLRSERHQHKDKGPWSGRGERILSWHTRIIGVARWMSRSRLASRLTCYTPGRGCRTLSPARRTHAHAPTAHRAAPDFHIPS